MNQPSTAPSAPLRVVIADDQALVRAGFRMILAADDIDVVGEAGDGVEAVELVRQTRPEVVLMDIRMPRLDGLEATRRIMAESAAYEGPAAGSGSATHIAADPASAPALPPSPSPSPPASPSPPPESSS